MKTYPIFLLAVSVLAGLAAERQPAAVRLYCNSLRFQDAAGKEGGQTFTFQLTTAAGFSEINGELAPLFSTNLPTHSAFFRMQDPNFPDPITGRIAFDTPAFADNNTNGFDDFFEVTQPLSATSEGFFTTSVDSGKVLATWNRAAGSTAGTCRLKLTSSSFGQLPEFTHSFQLLEYTGALAYTPNTNHITGILNLSQTGNAANTLSGAVTFTRVPTNRLDEIILLQGSLVNAGGQVLTFDFSDIVRDLTAKTNYFGFFDFDDGDLNTATADFRDWVLSINDPNDANSNGIPDLSDDLSSSPGSGPLLRLARGANRLLLSVSGQTGKTLDLEEILSIHATNWSRTASLTMTNDPQTIELPLPNTKTRFWRMRVQ